MIYILTEQTMNGTVTMSIVNTGIEAESFEQAKQKVMAMENFEEFDIHEYKEGITLFPNEKNRTDPMFYVTGFMHKFPLKII